MPPAAKIPPAAKNGTFAVLERRKRFAKLYLRGQSQCQIARELNVNQATVSRDLEALREDWREANALMIDGLELRELAKLDLIEIEAWDAWEKSKANKERTTKERSSGESSTNSKVVVTVEGRLPIPEFLAKIQWCILRRCQILGLDAAKKLEHSGDVGGGSVTEAEQNEILAAMTKRLAAMQAGEDEDRRGNHGDVEGGAAVVSAGPEPDPGG